MKWRAHYYNIVVHGMNERKLGVFSQIFPMGGDGSGNNSDLVYNSTQLIAFVHSILCANGGWLEVPSYEGRDPCSPASGGGREGVDELLTLAGTDLHICQEACVASYWASTYEVKPQLRCDPLEPMTGILLASRFGFCQPQLDPKLGC